MELAKKLRVALKESKSLEDIYSVLNCNSSKSLSYKMKWVYAVLVKMGIQRLEDLLAQRRLEKKKEEHVKLEEQAKNSSQFIRIFKRELELILVKLGIQRDHSDVFTSENYQRVINGLLDKLEKSKFVESSAISARSVSVSEGLAKNSKGSLVNRGSYDDSDKSVKSTARKKVVDDLPKEIGKIGQIQKLNQLEVEIKEIKIDYEDFFSPQMNHSAICQDLFNQNNP